VRELVRGICQPTKIIEISDEKTEEEVWGLRTRTQALPPSERTAYSLSWPGE